ncbi:MAG: NAD(P)H-hydrate epimerase [Tepidisphaeraceae bacterium]|jgi:NAD(P)H-hydrate epimerase
MLRLSRQQIRQIDRLAIQRYGIPGVVLMENAARAVAEAAWTMLGQEPHATVLVVCGGGNNGGDGLAAARHLHNRGADVRIVLISDPAKYENEAKINWEIVRPMKLPIASGVEGRPQLVVDAIFGTGLTQAPRPPFAQIVEAMHGFGVPILSVDIPSGLDCDSGKPLGPACVKATRTVTFVAEKIGFAQPTARQYLGEVTVADIGCPRELVEG